MSCLYPQDDKQLGVVGILETDPDRWAAFERTYSWITRALSPNDFVLDYGCGCGYGTQIMSAWVSGGHCVGVDKDETAIKYAQKRCKTVRNEFACDDVLDGNKVLGELFSVLVFSDMLSECEDPARLFQCLLPTLRPNGRVVIAEDLEKIKGIEDILAQFIPIRGYFGMYDRTTGLGYKIKACPHDGFEEGAVKCFAVGHLLPRKDIEANRKYKEFVKKHIGHPEGGLVYGSDGNRFIVVSTQMSETDEGTAKARSVMIRDFREERWGRAFEPGYSKDEPQFTAFRQNWKENYEANRDFILSHPGMPIDLPKAQNIYLVAPGRSLEKNHFELAGVRNGVIVAMNGACRQVPRGARHRIAIMGDARSLESWIPDDPEQWDLWASGIVPTHILEAPWRSVYIFRLTGSNPAFEDMNREMPRSVLVDSCLSVALIGMNLAIYMGCKTLVHIGMGDAWLAKDGNIKHHAKGTGYETVVDVPAQTYPITDRDGNKAFINEIYKHGTDAVAAQNYFFLEPARIKAALWEREAKINEEHDNRGLVVLNRKRRNYWLGRPEDEHIRVIDASECDSSILSNKYGNIPHELDIMPLRHAIVELERKHGEKRARRKRRRR